MAETGDAKGPTSARAVTISLLAWVGIAGALMLWAPAPPVAPTIDPEEDAVRQRMADWAVADARSWQAQHGDLTIPWERAHGHLAIVIDDVGRELRQHERLQALRFRLSFSVLPGARYAVGAQERLAADRRRPREVLLHLPMEPLDVGRMAAADERDEDFLRARDDPETLRRKLAAALARVPAARGINNHMGSRLSADPAAMAAIMPELTQRRLFFVDSRTTADTVAEAAARAAGVPTASRSIFLDHDARKEAIEAALAEAAVRAREQPTIVIAHPSPELVDVLAARLPGLHEQGIGIFSIGELVARTEAARRGGPASAQLAPPPAARPVAGVVLDRPGPSRAAAPAAGAM